jgi:hypothetical protein
MTQKKADSYPGKTGRVPGKKVVKPFHRATIGYPEDLYELIRAKGFHERRTMQEITLDAVYEQLLPDSPHRPGPIEPKEEDTTT